MNKLLFKLILHRSKPKNNQGFSLFEVTISILISSAFLMGTLQAMTINAVMQIKSERKAKANFWIQQDIEQLQAIASAMKLDNYILDTGEEENDQERDIRELLNSDDLNGRRLCRRSKKKKDERFGADFVKLTDYLLQEDRYPEKDPEGEDYPAAYAGKSIQATKSNINITANTKVFSDTIEFTQYEMDEDRNIIYTDDVPKTYTAKDSNGNNKKVVVQIVANGSEEEDNPDAQNNLINKNYRLVRLMSVDSQTKYDLVQVYYRVGEPYDPTDPNPTTRGKDDNNDFLRDEESGRRSIISYNYTEIMPAAVNECS
ncbi:MAG: hypothetical protein QNJ64_00200 [Crocosphaera sp.]|nr:hypothetical protein [Crocosphaera sp.]